MTTYRLLPVEPTEEMLATLREALPLGHEYLRAVYAALIAAAPQVPPLDERAAFERAAKRTYRRLTKDEQGEYADGRTETAWELWLAAKGVNHE